MYKGRNKLTKDEQQHLKEVAHVRTTSELERTFADQKQLRKIGGEPCWTCRIIAGKLGYPI